MPEGTSNSTHIYDRWHGYYAEDIDCTVCAHYRGKKLGCGNEVCLYEDELRDAESAGRIVREFKIPAWDG